MQGCLGALGGLLAGAVIGGDVGGPIGVIVGAPVGAVAGCALMTSILVLAGALGDLLARAVKKPEPDRAHAWLFLGGETVGRALSPISSEVRWAPVHARAPELFLARIEAGEIVPCTLVTPRGAAAVVARRGRSPVHLIITSA